MISEGFETDSATRLETNLDDCPAELIGAVFARLMEAGALDVWLTPIQMKKQRPGVLLSVLCTDEQAPALADIIFRETTAFGLRMEKVLRLKLARRFQTVETEFGEVTVKLGLKGEEVLQVAPEFESCRQLAEALGRPLKEVYEAALRSYHGQRRGSAG